MCSTTTLTALTLQCRRSPSDLLDTPTSIFEDSRDETWLFTCTTFVDETTTNVVDVTGTPTDPGGVPLCAGEPCDATAQDRETVTVVVPGSITIVKLVRGDDNGAFAFDGSLGPFTLTTAGGTASSTFDDLAPAAYRVEEHDGQGLAARLGRLRRPDVELDRQRRHGVDPSWPRASR